MCLNVRVNVNSRLGIPLPSIANRTPLRLSDSYDVTNCSRGTTLSPRHRAGLLGESARLSRLRRKLGVGGVYPRNGGS